MDYKLLLDTAVLAGELMLTNDAEIFRVEGTISHIIRTSGLKTTQAFATTTGIMVTLDDPRMDSLTVVRRIHHRSTNLCKIDMVNTISRKYCAGELTLEETFHQLKHLKENTYRKIEKDIATVICTASFAVLFGGGWLELVAAAADGLLLALAFHLWERAGLNMFLQNMLSSIVIAIGAIAISKIPEVQVMINPVIIGVIMPMVPGAAITNAVRDTLSGDFTAGGAKALEAFVTATSIAMGVGFGFLLMGGL